jgi:hypothetical protein
MKSTKSASVTALIALVLSIQAAAASHALEDIRPAVAQWSVQVEQVETGDVNLEPAFRIVIYENLIDELSKTKQFKQVFRSGDRSASGIRDLLILKTTVQSSTQGSETKRAVTTVSGATKLKVLSQLCTRDGQVVLERSVDGDVRFFGDNLRATHNLAHNEAKAIKQSVLPATTEQATAERRPSR